MKSEELKKELEEKFSEYLLQLIKEREYYLRSHQQLKEAIQYGIVQVVDIIMEDI